MPLSVSIYSSSGGSVGTLVANGLLTGATYPTTGTDVWTTASGSPVLLSSSTEYFLVATTSASPEEYNWAFVTGDQSTSNDGWAIPAGYDYSLNQGGSWGQSTATALFSVTAADATAAPEPGTWKCLIAALAVTGMVRVIRRRAGKIFIEWATNLR